jgi:putative permease
MLQIITTWFRRYFSDPEAVALLFILLAIILLFRVAGHVLAPAFASLVLAYLLQGIVVRLERLGFSHVFAVLLTFSLFIGLLSFAVFWLVPLLWEQASHLIHQLPQMVNQGQLLLNTLAKSYPDYISTSQLQNLLFEFKTDLARIGQLILSASIAGIPTIMMLVVYLVLVPLMVYFFLMDKTLLLNWIKKYFPKKRSVIRKLWAEVNRQIGNYVRGRVIEIILVSLACCVLFGLLHLNYAMLLSALVGFSVIIPYIGAVLVTIPVVVIGFFQWGWHSEFGYLMLGYSILLAVDANILVPLLFSGVVSLHPIAIILAILFFGGLWGFWGIFFAIPLAIVIKAILEIWPKHHLENMHETQKP